MSIPPKIITAYYKWIIYFDKTKCVWSNLVFSIVNNVGNGQWEIEENQQFCILTYHSNILNDNTEPDLPSDLGYPEAPASSYCSLLYSKWRVVQSDSYAGDPFQVSFELSPGDDRWRKVTPFEYEMISSKSTLCAENPANPSFANTVLKHDSETSYRQFVSRVKCNSNSLLYVSGPTYLNNVSTKGNARWVYSDNSSIDSDGQIVFQIEWVSSTKGFGTFPHNFIDNDLVAELNRICLPETAVSENIEQDNIIISNSIHNIGEVGHTGYPVFRVVYNCDQKIFGEVEVISISNESSISGADIWEFYDQFEYKNERNCVFYYLSSHEVKGVQLADINNFPSTLFVPLDECPCSSEINVLKTLEKIEIISIVISNAIGRASSVNNIYELIKKPEDAVWICEAQDLEIILKYNFENWNFELSYEYEQNRFFRINHTILLSDIYVGKVDLVFAGNVLFDDYGDNGYCAITLRGNIFENVAESSSSDSLSESSSSSDSSVISAL